MKAAESIEFIKKSLGEGKEYLNKGDSVQASEKLYKAVEECLKLVAKQRGIPEYEEAEKEGRWWSRLLARAAMRLSHELGAGKIEVVWAKASDLHVWGFHERALSVAHIEPHLPYVEWLLGCTKEILDESDKRESERRKRGWALMSI